MKTYIGILLISICWSSLFSQNLLSEVLRKDSHWVEGVNVGIENYVKFKTNLLKFESQELQILLKNLDSILVADLDQIDEIYKREVYNFKVGFSEIMLKNQNMLYGYAYLDAIILIENFLVYPNIYGMLLNPVRLSINPKLDRDTKENSEILVNRIHDSILKIPPKKLMETKKYMSEFNKNVPDNFYRIFQGALSEVDKTKYEIINFFILMNRIKKKK